MADGLTFDITSDLPTPRSIYLFQEPADFLVRSGRGGDRVHSVCLFSGSIEARGKTTIRIGAKPYAAIQETAGDPAPGRESGIWTRSEPVELTPSRHEDARAIVTLSGEPLRLDPARRGDTRRANSFRIETDGRTRAEPTNLGLGVEVADEVRLSSFVVAEGHINLECAPVARFYVQFGEVEPGVIIDFARARQGAAVCDFTDGGAVAGVRLRSDGVLAARILDRL